MRLKSPTDTPIHVSLLSGHTIQIGPEGRDVPEMFRRDAFALGAIPFDMAVEDFKEPEKEFEKPKADLLADGIKKMLAEMPEKFTGAGLPDRRTLSNLVGWNVSVQELSAAWQELQKEAAE